ncbi:membrane metallo-endopeptidase-like 1 [Rhipicephalus microplus]|uniref:membrane metallo-endopeptidase-like 1 n=1 Tax=Rhipicephalus microplus TaxID=6941 RepID=UPI003F6C2CDD
MHRSGVQDGSRDQVVVRPLPRSRPPANAKKRRTPLFWCRLLTASAVVAGATAACVTAYQMLLERDAEEPCTTDACRGDHSRLAAIVEPSKAPCDDFYGFVCSGATWQQGGGAMFIEVENENLRRLNASLIGYAISKSAHSFGRLATFYASCHNAFTGQHDLRTTIRSFLRNLGVSLREWLRAKTLEDLLDHVAYLSLHRSIPSFLWIRIEPSGLVFVQPALPLSIRLKAPVYSDILGLLRSFVNAFEEIRKQEERIFDLHVINVRLHAVPITDECIVVHARQALRFLTDQEMLVWLSKINKYLPTKSRLAPDSQIVIRNADFLGNLSRFLQVSHREVRNLYILMTLLEAVEWEYARSKFSRSADVAFETVKYCAAMSQTLMPKLWTSFVTRTLVIRETNARAIRDVVATVTERFKDDFAAVTWQNEVGKVRTLQWMSAMRWRLPDERDFDEEAARASIAHVPEMSSSHFLNVGYLRLLTSTDTMDEDHAAEKPVVTYDYNRNTLTVTVGALVKPLYYSDGEIQLNMASLGFVVAFQLWNAVVRYATWEQQPPSPSLWVLEGDASCFIKGYRNLSEEPVSSDTFIKLELHNRVNALRTILGASSRFLDMSIKKPAPKWPQVTQLQFFFIRYCSMMCTKEVSGLYRNLYCDIPVSSTSHFRNAFQCSIKDTLGAKTSCGVS